MTRSRTAQPGDIPTSLMAEYYAQRASRFYSIRGDVPLAQERATHLPPGFILKSN